MKKAATLLRLTIMLLPLAGCTLGQTVMYSKGEYGILRSFFGSSGEYCKMTAEADYEYTEQDREALHEYCKPFEQKVIDRLDGRN